jgi:hypothetical protein
MEMTLDGREVHVNGLSHALLRMKSSYAMLEEAIPAAARGTGPQTDVGTRERERSGRTPSPERRMRGARRSDDA